MEELNQLRSVLTEITLRLGFAAAARQLPTDFRGNLTTIMRHAERLDTLDSAITDFLTVNADKAPPAPRNTQLSKVFSVITKQVPKALEVLEAFIRNWHQMDSITLEFLEWADQPIFSTIVKVLPEKEIRIAEVMIFQPTIVFKGTSKIIVISELPATNETVVIFEPQEDGGVELRFEGIIYSLARLFALPLDNGRLREVRVFTKSQKEGTQIVHAAILLEAHKDKTDPRRLLIFQDTRKKKLLRKLFSVQRIVERKEQAFSYINSQKHYSFQRIKELADNK